MLKVKNTDIERPTNCNAATSNTIHRSHIPTEYMYSVGIGAKQSGTVKNVEHSNNDYHERSKQVPKNWRSGDFDAKWQEKELHK